MIKIIKDLFISIILGDIYFIDNPKVYKNADV